MKKILYVLALGCVLMGCRSKIDLGNMDTKTQVQMGMALPVGSIHMSLKDILGEVKGLYIDSVDNKGVLTWKMDTSIARYYHQMDLAQYFSTAHKDLNVYDAIKKVLPIPVPTIPFKPEDIGLTDGLEFSMEFPLTLHLDGINKDKTDKERLDKAEIKDASFVTFFKSDDLPFDLNWVDSVYIDLGDRFEFKDEAGNIDKTKNRIQIFPIDNIHGRIDDKDSIFITIEDFVLNMMIKNNPDPDHTSPTKYLNNVYDSCDFKIKLQFTIPKDTKVTLTENSKISYDLGAKFLNFSYILGAFEPSKDMYDESVIDLGKNWGKLNFLTSATVPFYEPVIDAQIVTSVAGALRLQDTYLFVEHMTGDTTFAWFKGFGSDESKKWFNHTFEKGEYLDVNSPVDAISDNMYVQFDRTTEKGQIHRLFSHMPHKLGYRFSINFDFYSNTGTPQIRITPYTTIRVNTKCRIPFIFDKGVKVNYPDTADNINLSKLSLDSLQNEMSVIDTLNATNLKLVMIAQNTIPLHVKATMRCLDKNDQPIMDPKDPSKPFLLFDQDTIVLDPPTYTKLSNSQIVPTSDGKTIISTNLDKDELNTLPRINKIIYSAQLDDEALQYAYNMGLVNVRLTEDQGVTFKIGVAGNIDAVLNFEKNNK